MSNDSDRIRKLAEKMGVVCGTPKDAPIEYPHIIIGTHKTIYCRSRAYIFWIDLDDLSPEAANALMNSKAWGNWDIHKGGPWWYVLHHTTREQIAREKTFGLAVLAAVEGRE